MSEKLFNNVHNSCINNKYSISVSRFPKNANFLKEIYKSFIFVKDKQILEDKFKSKKVITKM